MNLKKIILGFSAIALLSLSAHADWEYGGIDFTKPPIQNDFLSKANGGTLDNERALKDGVGVKIFGFGFGKGDFRKANKVLLDSNGTIPAAYTGYFASTAGGGVAGGATVEEVYPVTNNIYGGLRAGKVDCFTAEVGTEGTADNGINYLVVDNTTIRNHLDRAETLCTSHVTNMAGLFKDNHSFNQSITTWDTSHVTDMTSMFENATSFYQMIGDWNVYSVEHMDNMFKGATEFNDFIDSWYVNNPTHVDFALNSGLDPDRYPAFPPAAE